MGCWLSSGLQSQWNPCASQVALVAKGKKKESLLLSSLLCNPTVCSPLSMGFSSQEHWSGLPFSPPGDLPIQGIKPGFLHLLYCRRIFFFFTTESPICLPMQVDVKRCQFEPWVGKILNPAGLRDLSHSHPLQYFCLENLMDRGAWHRPQGCKESGTTEAT